MLAVFCFITCDVVVVCLQGWENVWESVCMYMGVDLGVDM